MLAALLTGLVPSGSASQESAKSAQPQLSQIFQWAEGMERIERPSSPSYQFSNLGDHPEYPGGRPRGVAVTRSGDIFLADSRHHCIRKIQLPAAAAAAAVAGAGTNGVYSKDSKAKSEIITLSFVTPTGLAMSADGDKLIVADGYTDRIVSFDLASTDERTVAGSTERGEGDGPALKSSWTSPHSLCIDRYDGTMYVTSLAPNNAVRVIKQGRVSTMKIICPVGENGPDTLSFAYGLAVYDGNLFVADHSNHCIRKIHITTGRMTTVAGSPGCVGAQDGKGGAARFNNPSGLAIDGAGNLVVCDKGNHAIRLVHSQSGKVTTLSTPLTVGNVGPETPTLQGLFYPEYCAINGDGNVIVSDSGNHRVCLLSGCGLIPPWI